MYIHTLCMQVAKALEPVTFVASQNKLNSAQVR